MKKSTKGALAAGVAAVLLLGGAGSLAYWTDTQTIAGGAITAGTLEIGTPDCTGGWTYDDGEDANGAIYTPGTSKLVPGDVISETCTTALTATGEHMRGTITASSPADTTPFQVAVGSIADATTPLAAGGTFTEQNDGDNLSVTITVTFPASSDDTTRLAAETLDSITLTATQIHS